MNPVLFSYLAMLTVIVVGIFLAIPFWRLARSGANISPLTVIFVAFRKTAKTKLFKAVAVAQQSQLKVTLMELEVHLLGGGDPLKVVTALSKYRGRPGVDFKHLCVLDLYGKDLERSIAEGGAQFEIELFKVPVGAFFVDVQAVLSSWSMDEPEVDDKEKTMATLERKIRASESLLMGLEYEKALKMMKDQVLNATYYESLGLVLVSQQIRLRKAN